MALATFAPTQAPNRGGGWDTKPRVLLAPFGDGYEQRTPDGLNTMQRTGSWEWNPCPPAVADYIENFMRATKGATPFWWTPPRAGAPIKFRCAGWRRNHPEWSYDGISVALIEVFDQGS